MGSFIIICASTLEHLSISLPHQLRDPLICHPPRAKPSRVGRPQVVDPEVAQTPPTSHRNIQEIRALRKGLRFLPHFRGGFPGKARFQISGSANSCAVSPDETAPISWQTGEEDRSGSARLCALSLFRRVSRMKGNPVQIEELRCWRTP